MDPLLQDRHERWRDITKYKAYAGTRRKWKCVLQKPALSKSSTSKTDDDIADTNVGESQWSEDGSTLGTGSSNAHGWQSTTTLPQDDSIDDEDSIIQSYNDFGF
jgi:hypothetical protein